MRVETAIAIGIGLLSLVAVVKALWDMVVSFEYPLDVKGDRWREVRYSIRERFEWWRVLLLVVGVPILSSVLVYAFAVGVREVFF